MDQPSAGGTARESVPARSRQVRAHARDRRDADGGDTDRFQPPQWLERSFVLPLSDRGVTVVPSQSQPHHDDLSKTPLAAQRPMPGVEVDPAAASVFVRPPSQEIDFARMIKRSDHCRTAGRAATASVGVAGLGLIAFLLMMDPVALVVAIVGAVMAVVSIGVRVRLATASVPLLEP